MRALLQKAREQALASGRPGEAGLDDTQDTGPIVKSAILQPAICNRQFTHDAHR